MRVLNASSPSPPGSPVFILLLAVLMALAAISIDIALPAVPAFIRELGASPAAAQWTVSAYLLGYSIGQLVLGPLSDRWGRRPVVLAAVALYSVAGVGCALSQSIGAIITLRVVQALGGAAGPVLARAIIRDLFDQHTGARVLSMSFLVVHLAPLLAPIIGGYLVTQLGWPSIFYAMAGIGVLLLARSATSLPETLPAGTVKAANMMDIVRTFRQALGNRVCLSHSLVLSFSISGLFAFITGSSLVIVEVFGYSEQQYGFFFFLAGLSLILANFANNRLLKRTSVARMLDAGVACLSLGGLATVATAIIGWGGIVALMASMMVYVAGVGVILPNATAAALAPMGAIAGTASSLLGAMQMFIATLVSTYVGAAYEDTAVAMGSAMAGSAALALATYLLLVRRSAEEPGGDHHADGNAADG